MSAEVEAQNQAAALSDPTITPPQAEVARAMQQANAASPPAGISAGLELEARNIFARVGLYAYEIEALFKHIEQLVEVKVEAVLSKKK